MMIILMPLLFLLSVQIGFCLKPIGTCRPFCFGSDCITLNHDRVDFTTAEEACHERNGELLTFQPEIHVNILYILSQEFYGNFWIGLRLPAGACSNLSTPLRGYEWTSGSFTPSSSIWRESVEVCSPRCVSLSHHQKWTERLCTDKANGFLCRIKHKDACQAQGLSDANVFQSSKDCSSGPCEHICMDVKGGYKCSCFKGYIPDSSDPHQCILHCAQEKCPLICDRKNRSCFCPDGFLNDGAFCVDIDECSMDACDQQCKNSPGSFECSCREGFVPKGEVKCVKATKQNKNTVIIGSVRTDTNNTLKGSSSPAGSFLWIWISLVVAVIVFIVVLRFYVVRRLKPREQNSNQQSAVPEDNIQL